MIVSCMLVFLTEFTGFIKESERERGRTETSRSSRSNRSTA